jgi:hypothetical protein
MPSTMQRSVLLVVLCATIVMAAQTRYSVRRYLSTMPLDNELIELLPARQKLTMMLTWDCPEIEGWELMTKDDKKLVRDIQGKQVEFYPERLRFRFTIGSKTMLQGRTPLPYDTPLNAQQLAAGLRFQLKRFHEIQSQTFAPISQEMIGVPATIPYDERIYRIEFRIPKVRLEDRFALEVVDANGSRVAKFPVYLL